MQSGVPIARPRLDRAARGIARYDAVSADIETFSRPEVAERAGVDVTFVDRLVEAGILSPGDDDRFSTGDVQRVGVALGLERGGLSLEALGEAVQQGRLSLGFVDQPSYSRYAALGRETFREVAARTGVPLELVMVIREAIGFAQPSPDDRVRAEELEVLPLVQLHIAEGFAPTTIDRWLRAYGDSLRRIAETEADWFRTEILEPMFAAGKSVIEIGERTGRLDDDLSRLGDQALLALFHGQQANAWMKNIFEGIEGALAGAGTHVRIDRPPAICFLDLTGYTRLTDERGDEAAAELAGRLARLVQRTSLQHGGKPVKWLGDGVMFYFREPGRACSRPSRWSKARGRRPAAGPCRPSCRTGPVPGGRLLRADGERGITDRRLRSAGRGPRQPGGGRRVRWSRRGVHRDRPGRAQGDGRVAPPARRPPRGLRFVRFDPPRARIL